MGPTGTGPRWAPCWPHDPCYLGGLWLPVGFSTSQSEAMWENLIGIKSVIFWAWWQIDDKFAPSHYLNWWWKSFTISHGISNSRWTNCLIPSYFIKSVAPSDTIWLQKSGSTLAQVMACCLMAPSHYLNRCWLINTIVLWHSSEGIIMRRSEDAYK